MKNYNTSKRLSASARRVIQNAIDGHEKYKSAYFWKSSGVASGRRSNEQRFAATYPPFSITNNDGTYYVTMEYSESAKNVYYRLVVRLENANNVITVKNVSALKKMLN